MTTAPVIASTLSPDYIGSFAIEKYGLENILTAKLFRTGINHTYFLFGNQKKYALRVYSFNWRTKTEIQEEIRLLLLLKEKGISASYPVADKSGNYLQTVPAPEGRRYVVLFTFAEGNKIRNLTHKACYFVGNLMSRFHQVTMNQVIKRIFYNPETLFVIPYQFARLHFPEKLEEMKFVNAARELFSNGFESIQKENLRTGIVHLDIWYDNMNILDEEQITLFDFDFCGNGWFILDVAYFCMQLFHIEAGKKSYQAKVDAFLEGYETITPLTSDERKLIPYAGLAVWIFYLGVQSERFEWSNVFLSENYLKMYLGKIKSWLDFHGIKQS